MSKRHVDLIVVCEDKQHQSFLIRLLRGLGYRDRRNRVLRANGEGAAEQWVRMTYPQQVAAIRQQRKRQNLGLVTALDADGYTVLGRHRQLGGQLRSDGQAARGPRERICLLIPRRNIETWIWWLLGHVEATETEDYKSILSLVGRERDCQPAVDALIQRLRSGGVTPANVLPSLAKGCQELRRLP